ncbi:MAG: dephospho-CoA kinase [Armatimonadetes bacterium]|nr:dephospho-CoA kinase [Armatimonadota bacterium]
MKIALTGGIASGKSTLLTMLRECGASVINADAIARDILWNSNIQARLMSLAGSEEPISPVFLRDFIAASDKNRRAVNRIMHPAIAEELAASTATVIEVPLLFEACLHVAFDAIWVAFCTHETQSKRLRDRYGEQADYPQFSWQLDSKVALAFADAVISTETGEPETRASLLQEAKRWGLPLVVS